MKNRMIYFSAVGMFLGGVSLIIFRSGIIKFISEVLKTLIIWIIEGN